MLSESFGKDLQEVADELTAYPAGRNVALIAPAPQCSASREPECSIPEGAARRIDPPQSAAPRLRANIEGHRVRGSRGGRKAIERESASCDRRSFDGASERGATMRGLLAPLSSNEEVTLRRVAIGSTYKLPAQHLKRLEQLKLIESNGGCYQLTPLGRQRYNALPKAAALANDGSPGEIEQILSNVIQSKDS